MTYVVLRASSPVQPSIEDLVAFVVERLATAVRFVVVVVARSAPEEMRLGANLLIVDAEDP